MKKKQSKTSWWNKHCKGEQSGLVNEAKCTHWNEHEHILQLSWNRLRVLWYDNSRLSYFNEYFSAREKKNFPSIPPRLFLRSRFSSTYLYTVTTTHHMSIKYQCNIQKTRYPSFNGVYFLINITSRPSHMSAYLPSTLSSCSSLLR
jgi:hypothetical protein